MTFETTASYDCQWKVTGINRKVSHQNWVLGKFILQHQNNVYRCALTLASNPKREPYCYHLTSKIKELQLKNRILIELFDGVSIHVKEVLAEEHLELARVLNKVRLKQVMSASKRKEVSSPIQIQRSPLVKRPVNGETLQPSPARFTGVKDSGMSRRERMQAEAIEDEQRKINKVSDPQTSEYLPADSENFQKVPNKFLENSQRKSDEALSGVKAKNFYSSSAPSRSYGSLGHLSKPRRSPGLMPLHQDRGQRSRLGELSNQSPTYSWNSRALTSPSPGSNSLQGFSNLGNTCYMNAILQSLLTLDSFSTDLLHTTSHYNKLVPCEQRKAYLSFMLSRLLQVKRKEGSTTEMKKLVLTQVKRTITSSAKRFSGYEQHDAHEFLGQILDQLKEEVLKLRKKTVDDIEEVETLSANASPQEASPQETSPQAENPNPTRDNFEFKVAHQITCTQCLEMVETCETFHDLSIDMPPKKALEPTSSIQDALDHFFLDELLEYTCEQCGGKEARVQHKFIRLPRVLIVHLKRYTFNCVTSSNMKLGQNIMIPKYLTLKSQCEQDTQPAPPVRSPVSTFSKLTPSMPDVSFELESGKSPQERRTSTSRRKLDLGGEETGEQKPDVPEDTSLDWVLKKSKETATDEINMRKRIDSLTMQSMTDEEMMSLAMERSMVDNSGMTPTHAKPDLIHTNTQANDTECVPTDDVNSSESTEDSKTETVQLIKDNPIIWGPKDEPPSKRTRFEDHTDSAYSSFTDESTEEKGSGAKQEMETEASSQTESTEANSGGDSLEKMKVKPEIHVDLSLSDEENKENYTPLRSPETGSNDEKAAKAGSKLHKEEELDEEAQIQQAIELSLKDQEQYLILNHEDELAKAKELSLQDDTPGKAVSGQPRQPASWKLTRTKEEQVTLARHAEQGDLPYSYQLISVVSHLGSSSSLGHYISDVYDARKRAWLSWDDSHMSKMQEDDIRKNRERTGYIFFYVSKESVQDLEEYFYQQRRNSRSASLSSSLPPSVTSLHVPKTVTVQPGSATRAPTVNVFSTIPSSR